MSSCLAIQAHEDAAPTKARPAPIASMSIPWLDEVLSSPLVHARLPKSAAGKFLLLVRSRAGAAGAVASRMAAREALVELASIVETERALDVLTCEDAGTGELLHRASFDAGPRYVHASSFHGRELAEHPLRSVPGVPLEGFVPELVLPGFTHRPRVIEGVEREVREALPIRLRWSSVVASHAAEWAALRAFVEAHAALRLVVE
jgi:hypothetical protein